MGYGAFKQTYKWNFKGAVISVQWSYLANIKHRTDNIRYKRHNIIKAKGKVNKFYPYISVSDMTCPDEYYTTIEEPDLFCQCYQHTVDDFNAAVEIKKAKKPSKGVYLWSSRER